MSTSLIALLPISITTSILTMTMQRKHLLMALLTMEMMILCLCLFIPSALSKTNSMDTPMLLNLLTFGASEASLGLACLVNLMRTKGNDLIKSSNSTKC